MEKEKKEPLSPSVALRRLADNTGAKWYRMLKEEHDGLGHIHDCWREMYRDMEAIVCLEKFIADNDPEDGAGCDFRPVPGLEKYNKD